MFLPWSEVFLSRPVLDSAGPGEMFPVVFLQRFCKSEITLNMQFKNLVCLFVFKLYLSVTVAHVFFYLLGVLP